MTEKDLKLLKKTGKNRIYSYTDWAFLIMTWLTAIGYLVHFGRLETAENLLFWGLTAMVAIDITHRKWELRLLDLFKRSVGNDGTSGKETSTVGDK